MTTDDVVRIRKILVKSGSIDYFLEKMNGYGLGFALTKYLMLALFHVVKTDQRFLPRILVPAAQITNVNLAEFYPNWEAVFQRLQSFAGNDLEESAEKAAEILTSNRDFHALMIFYSVMTKFLNF